MPINRFVTRMARRAGVHVQRWHDPYQDFARLVPPGEPTEIIDGGAHRGETIERLRSVFPNARIHSFEPQPVLFKALKQQFDGRSDVKIYPFALSDKPGEATLYVYEKDYTTSLLKNQSIDANTLVGEEKVPLVTLDEWAAAQQAAPKLIKLDLQGHELSALRGATSLLAGSVLGIVTEVNFRPRYEQCSLWHEIAGFLWEQGFSLYRLYELWGDTHGNWLQGDALFVRNSLIEH